MFDIEIKRPSFADLEELKEFFTMAITDTFEKEGLGYMVEFIQEEIETKEVHIKEDLASRGEKRYFLLAFHEGKIIGTIGYGPANELIIKGTEGKLKEVVEIGGVFVHPSYQQQGVATLLFNMIYLTMQNRNIEQFCLDSGYVRAQKVWRKKFGAPDYVMKAYWGEGFDHMIWTKNLEEVRLGFRMCGGKK